MAKMTIPALVEGGKASAGPPLGPALGPAGVNIGQVIATINEKTKAFVGMQVPVKVVVDKDSKTFEIEIGTPPVSALIKKELGIAEAVKEEAGVKGKKTIGNLTMEQCTRIYEMKKDATLALTKKTTVKEIVGTCLSMGVTVEGKSPKEIMKQIDAGEFDKQLKN